MSRSLRPTVAVFAVAAFTVLGCRQPYEKQTAADSVANPAGAASATPSELTGNQSLTDAQIAHVVMTANNGEVDLGNLAKDKAQNADVKTFGQDMVNDHGSANQKGNQLAQKINLTPEANDLSRQLQQDGEKTRAKLDSLSGAAFDKAYIDAMVTGHETVLNALDNTLIPNAQNADLKSFLQNIRPTVAQHLDHAKQLQSKLSG